jgi:hypothetical protein
MPGDQLNATQEVVLDIVADTYSTPEAMLEEVKILLGNGVSLAQIETALVELRDRRLVDAFVRREGHCDYERYRRSTVKAGVAVWWHATEQGIRHNQVM